MELTTASPRVVVAGWSGTVNLGDELLLRALLHLLAERGWTATVVSRDPAATTALHGVDAISLGDLPGLWRAVRNARGLVLGPGTLLQDQTSPASLPWHLSRVVTASIARRPIVGVGLGVGPLQRRGSRRLVGAALRRCRAVAVRDPASAALAAACGVKDVLVGSDLAFVLPPPTGEVVPRIAVSLRAHDPAGGTIPLRRRPMAAVDRSRIASIAAGLNRLGEERALPVHLVAMDGTDDVAVHDAVARHLRVPFTSEVPDLDGVLAAIGRSSLVVAMRFHAGVAGVLGGRPTVLLGYSPKVAGLTTPACAGVVHLTDDPAGWAGLVDAAQSAMGGEGTVERLRSQFTAGTAAHRRALDALDA